MRDGDIVVLTFRTLLGKIGGKGWIPMADIFSSIEDGVAELSGTALFHAGIAIIDLSGLVGGRREASISQQLIGGFKP